MKLVQKILCFPAVPLGLPLHHPKLAPVPPNYCNVSTELLRYGILNTVQPCAIPLSPGAPISIFEPSINCQYVH
jgi:hypothetical protein